MLRRVVFLLALAPFPLAAAPPPPLAPGTVEHATPIITVPPASELENYLHHFTADVHVIENDKLVATDLPGWRAYLESHRYSGHKVDLVSYGNPIMVAESTWLLHNECCLSARVVTYHFRENGLVDEVKIISNNMYWGDVPDIK